MVVHGSRQPPSDVPSRLATVGRDIHLECVRVDRELSRSVASYEPEVVIIDHDPDAFDAARVCRDLRVDVASPIIVLSPSDSPDAEATAIAALDSGADDVLPATVSGAMLRARIRAALRKRAVQRRRDRWEIGDLVVDVDAHVVRVGGVEIACPPREFRLISALAAEPGRVLDSGRLSRAVWGDDRGIDEPQRLRVCVSLARRILGAGPALPVIHHVASVGYRMELPGSPR